MKVRKIGILSVISIGMMVFVMSGCGSSTTKAPEDNPIIPPPLKDMTTVQAKDAMALNALFYPVVIPLQSCLGDIKQCIIDLYNPSATATSTAAAPMTPGAHNCTDGNPSKGQYTVDVNDGTSLVVKFDTDPANPGCYDVENGQDIQEALAATCINTILGTNIGSPSAVNVSGTSNYEVEYEGKVTCTKDTSVVFDGYVVSRFGQPTSSGKNPNRYSYNMTVSMTDGLGIDGTYQAEKWEASDTAPYGNKINDETWTFNAFNIAAGRTTAGTTIVANGGASYVGAVREGDEENNGMTLNIDFANLSYAISGSLANSEVAVNGGVSASCQPEMVTYSTPATMNDLDNVRDAAANRMPNSGSMTVALPGYNPAPAKFSAPGTAQVTITASEGPTVYDSWRAITTASSCAGLQEIIDRIIPAKKPIDSIEISEGCSLNEGTLITETNPLELKVLEQKCINAFATYSDGTRSRVTTSVFWTSSDRNIATMPLLQTSSKVTGISEGNTTVNATLYGVTGSAPVNVSPLIP